MRAVIEFFDDMTGVLPHCLIVYDEQVFSAPVPLYADVYPFFACQIPVYAPAVRVEIPLLYVLVRRAAHKRFILAITLEYVGDG